MENTTEKLRTFEQQTALERTLRATLWIPQDKLRRAESSLVDHVKKQEYQLAANCQVAILKATNEIKMWYDILSLYEQERQSPAQLPPSTDEIRTLREALLLYHEAWNGCEGDWHGAMQRASKNAEAVLWPNVPDQRPTVTDV